MLYLKCESFSGEHVIATTEAMHRRIQGISPVCQRFVEENEFVGHMIFFCLGSRATWFALGLNIRIEEMPMQFKEALLYIATKLSPTQMSIAENAMWCLWKARNAMVIEGTRFRPLSIIQQAKVMPVPNQKEARSIIQPQKLQYLVYKTCVVLLVDAS
jgi:hypothetical protein